MSQKITVIPGDGIGPEIMTATLRSLDALECGFEYEFRQADAKETIHCLGYQVGSEAISISWRNWGICSATEPNTPLTKRGALSEP